MQLFNTKLELLSLTFNGMEWITMNVVLVLHLLSSNSTSSKDEVGWHLSIRMGVLCFHIEILTICFLSGTEGWMLLCTFR